MQKTSCNHFLWQAKLCQYESSRCAVRQYSIATLAHLAGMSASCYGIGRCYVATAEYWVLGLQESSNMCSMPGQRYSKSLCH